MKLAVHEKLEGDTYGGSIPEHLGVIAFGDNLAICQNELRSAFEDRALVGARLGHELPITAGINLNLKLTREPVEAL